MRWSATVTIFAQSCGLADKVDPFSIRCGFDVHPRFSSEAAGMGDAIVKSLQANPGAISVANCTPPTLPGPLDSGRTIRP